MKIRRALLALALCLTTPWRAAGEAPPPAPPVQWKHDWANGAVFYQILVRSFADSNGDGKGDLPGLVSKLDYLNDGDPATHDDLGVDAIWLLPVFSSGSYHGYDTLDYDDIDRELGTNEDFQRLCREAHKRGIRVIVDLVLNHTSIDHPWFKDSASSPKSPKRDWYVWRPDDPGWTRPWSNDATWHKKNGDYYYGLFWSGMPDLNFRNPEVRAEAERIAKLWLDRGVDGFRLDAARHLIEGPDGEQADTPETHAFWKEFAAYVRGVRPDAILVGEVWTGSQGIAPYYGDTSVIAGGDELPMTFDFPIGGAIVSAVKTGKAVNVFSQLHEMQRYYPRGVLDAPFLKNHDQARVATELDGDLPRLRAAAAVLLTLPGAPFIYYGEEIGMRNYGPGFGSRGGAGKQDQDKRTPLPWDGTPRGGFSTAKPWHDFSGGHETLNVASERADPGSLLSRYRDLIALRHGSEALRQGELELQPAQEGILLFLRRSAGETVLVAHNLGATAASATGVKLPDGVPSVLFADPGVGALTPGKGGWTVEIPPFSFGAWKIQAGGTPKASAP
jgi:glycosidase